MRKRAFRLALDNAMKFPTLWSGVAYGTESLMYGFAAVMYPCLVQNGGLALRHISGTIGMLALSIPIR